MLDIIRNGAESDCGIECRFRLDSIRWNRVSGHSSDLYQKPLAFLGSEIKASIFAHKTVWRMLRCIWNPARNNLSKSYFYCSKIMIVFADADWGKGTVQNLQTSWVYDCLLLSVLLSAYKGYKGFYTTPMMHVTMPQSQAPWSWCCFSPLSTRTAIRPSIQFPSPRKVLPWIAYCGPQTQPVLSPQNPSHLQLSRCSCTSLASFS